jgi:hypothetical protein
MVAGGIDQEKIAAAFKIAPKTLRLHCRAELNGGADRAHAAVIASLFSMATTGRSSFVKFQAARYWLAARCGWRDTDRAVYFPQLIPFSEMTAEQFDQVLTVNGEDPVNLPPVKSGGHAGVIPFPRGRRR